jgi:hypothetical protein
MATSFHIPSKLCTLRVKVANIIVRYSKNYKMRFGNWIFLSSCEGEKASTTDPVFEKSSSLLVRIPDDGHSPKTQ